MYTRLNMIYGGKMRVGWRILTLLLLLISCGVAKATKTSVLRLGFNEDFFEGINSQDAMGAMKLWVEGVGKNRDLDMRVTSTVYTDRQALIEALEKDEVDLAAVVSAELVAMRDYDLLEPKFVSIRDGHPEEHYLLLVHRDSGITEPSALMHGKLLVLNNARTSLAIPWAEGLLGCDVGGLDQIFCPIDSRAKISKAVLPVFFKQADACLVTKSGFSTMAELNPQLEKQLVVVAESPGYVPTVICLRKEYESPIRDDIIQGMAELHQEAHGRQLLLLFRVDKLVEFEDSMLESVEQLMKRRSLSVAQAPERGDS